MAVTRPPATLRTATRPPNTRLVGARVSYGMNCLSLGGLQLDPRREGDRPPPGARPPASPTQAHAPAHPGGGGQGPRACAAHPCGCGPPTCPNHPPTTHNKVGSTSTSTSSREDPKAGTVPTRRPAADGGVSWTFNGVRGRGVMPRSPWERRRSQAGRGGRPTRPAPPPAICPWSPHSSAGPPPPGRRRGTGPSSRWAVAPW